MSLIVTAWSPARNMTGPLLLVKLKTSEGDAPPTVGVAKIVALGSLIEVGMVMTSSVTPVPTVSSAVEGTAAGGPSWVSTPIRLLIGPGMSPLPSNALSEAMTVLDVCVLCSSVRRSAALSW